MAKNNRTSRAGTPKALENVCFPADNSRDIAPAHILQARKLARRFGLSLAHASVVAEQAYSIPETWGSRA